MHATALACAACGHAHPLDARYACDRCFGPLEPQYDADAIRASVSRERIEAGPRTLWRYADFLPASPPSERPARRPHAAPARAAPRRGARAARGAASRSRARTPRTRSRTASSPSPRPAPCELGFTALACASTGNLAGAVAAQAAALGLEAYVFIPADLEREKIIAAAVPGARVFAVDGNYDDVNRLCAELAYDRPWAFVNMNLRPYYAQGSKTLAYETAEQLGWRLPAQTVAPIASGSLYTKLDRGYRDLLETGLVDGDAAARRLRRAGRRLLAGGARPGPPERTTVRPVRPDTIAKSLAIGAPADGENALRVASPHRRRDRRGGRRRDRRGASACSPAPPASSRRPPAAPPSRRSPGSPARGSSTPTARPSCTSPATA